MSFVNRILPYLPAPARRAFERIEASPLALRLAKGTFWSMMAAVMSRGLLLCATFVVVRILGKTVFGELGMIRSTVGMFGIFAGFGLGLTATKHVAQFRQSDPARAGRIIGLSEYSAMGTGGVMALALFFLAPWMAEHTINAPHLAGALRVGALILFINALIGAQTGALAGFEAFKAIARVNLFVGLFSFPILILGTYFGGLTGAVWALAINLGVHWLLNHRALNRETLDYQARLTIDAFLQELPILWKFSLPAVLAGLMVGPANWICQALLTNQPNGYDEMGILAAALVFQTLLMYATNMLGAPLLSMVANANPGISGQLGTVNILSSWVLGVMVSIPLLCFPEIPQALFGKDFDSHSFRVTFALVVFSSCINTFKAGLARVLAANSLMWWAFLSNTLWALTLVGSTYLLINWGAVGLACALTIAYALNAIILVPLYNSRKLVPRRTLISLEAITIWSTLLILVSMNVLAVPLRYRLLLFFPAVLISAAMFVRLMVTRHDKPQVAIDV